MAVALGVGSFKRALIGVGGCTHLTEVGRGVGRVKKEALDSHLVCQEEIMPDGLFGLWLLIVFEGDPRCPRANICDGGYIL